MKTRIICTIMIYNVLYGSVWYDTVCISKLYITYVTYVYIYTYVCIYIYYTCICIYIYNSEWLHSHPLFSIFLEENIFLS